MTTPPDLRYTQGETQFVEKLFGELFELSAAERAARLDEACIDAPELRRMVEQLLRDYDTPLPSLASAERGSEAASSGPPLPQRIGPYRIVERLGRGGMGVVYRAEQDRPRRHVALKVLLPTELESDSRERLANEAEVLGRLHHPGIAQIYDAGFDASPLGDQPYFAMELIDGPPLSDHCTESQADTRMRCELLAKVCDAVHHAHERGIIHRDLKPSNVLVATFADAEPQPKVLDFGIARCLDPDQKLATLTTQSGLVVGTLAYMSPEQFLLNRVDARSDVYSIGVMLYQLLSGALPHDFAGKSMTEVSRLFCEEAPRPPLRDEVIPTDLQTITARALAKEPEERYPTAAALRDDLRRFLADQPVHARPLTIRYQLRKFARRHRTFVAGVVATMLALVLGTVVSIAFLLDAQRARARAERETQRAKRNEYIAQLTTAATSMRLDPGGADAALARVRESAGLEWHLLNTRNDAAVPIRERSTPAGKRVAARVVDDRVLGLFVADRHAILRDEATEEVLLRVDGRFHKSAYGYEIAHDGSMITLLDDDVPARIRILNVIDGSVRCELTWAKYQRLSDVDVTLSHDGQFASLRYGEFIRRHVNLETLETIDLNAWGDAHADPVLPGIWYGRELHRWSDGKVIQSVADVGGVPNSQRPFPSPDGRFVIMRGNSHRNLEVMDRQSGKLVRRLPGHKSPPKSVAWSHDGAMLASCDWIHIRLWDTRTWQCLRTFESSAKLLAFTKDDLELIGVRERSEPSARYPARADGNRILTGHSDYVLAGALDPSGRILASGDTSHQLRLWDVESGDCIGVLQLDGQVEELAFSDDGWTLKCQLNGSPLTEVSLLGWQRHRIDAEWWPKRSARWRPGVQNGGHHLAVRRRWNATVGLVEQLEVVRTDSDGSKESFALDLANPGVATDRASADRRKIARAVMNHRGGPPSCVSPDRSKVCIGLDDGAIACVDLISKKLVAHHLRHQGALLTVAYTPDGKRLLSGGLDGVLRIWDTQSWDLLYSEQAHSRAIEVILISPTGDRIFTLSADRTIKIWDAEPRAARVRRLQANQSTQAEATAEVDRLWAEHDADLKVIGSRLKGTADCRSAAWPQLLRRHIQRVDAAR